MKNHRSHLLANNDCFDDNSSHTSANRPTHCATSHGKKVYTKPELKSHGLLRDITMAPTITFPQESGLCPQAFCGTRL